MAASRTNQNDNARAGTSCIISVENDAEAGRDEEDPKPSLVTSSSLLISSGDPGDHQEVVHEEATTDNELPAGWVRPKLEPDW
jgi:hypothetical protein